MRLVFFSHSAKGSEWEEHQYVKKVDGNYYYPEGYENGRTVSSLSENSKAEKKSESDSSTSSSTSSSGGMSRIMSDNEIESYALKVIRGDYGNGLERKEALGAYYQKIQDRVNQIMGTSGSVKMSDVSEKTVSDGEKLVKKAVSTSTGVSGVDLEQVFSVYNKKK